MAATVYFRHPVCVKQIIIRIKRTNDGGSRVCVCVHTSRHTLRCLSGVARMTRLRLRTNPPPHRTVGTMNARQQSWTTTAIIDARKREHPVVECHLRITADWMGEERKTSLFSSKTSQSARAIEIRIRCYACVRQQLSNSNISTEGSSATPYRASVFANLQTCAFEKRKCKCPVQWHLKDTKVKGE